MFVVELSHIHYWRLDLNPRIILVHVHINVAVQLLRIDQVPGYQEISCLNYEIRINPDFANLRTSALVVDN